MDAVDDFCDFVKTLNREEEDFVAKTGKSSEAFYGKKFKAKYTYDWQKDALNYHASVKTQREKDGTVMEKHVSIDSNESVTKAFQAEMGVMDDGRTAGV